MLVMDAIFRDERYGYLIFKGIARRFGSRLSFCASQVYATLRRLVCSGWIELDEGATAKALGFRSPGRGREVYRSTAKGRSGYARLTSVYYRLVDPVECVALTSVDERLPCPVDDFRGDGNGESLLIRKKEIAVLIGVSVPTVRRLIAEGALPAPVKCLIHLPLWRRSEIVAFVENLPPVGVS